MIFMLCQLAILTIVASCKFLNVQEIPNSNIQIQENGPLSQVYILPSDHLYYIIDVILEEEDQSFLVLYFDTSEQSQIQISSSYDGKLERHLIIENKVNKEQEFKIISNKSTKYQIKISSLMEIQDACFNECNHHGYCKDSICECYDGYFGKDCHSQVIPVNNSKQNILQISQEIQYYVMEINDKYQQIELSFQVENQCEIKINLFEDLKLSHQDVQLTANQKFIKVFIELNDKIFAKKFLVFAVEKYDNQNQNLRVLQHNNQNQRDQHNGNVRNEKDDDDDDDDDSSSTTIYIIIGSVGVAIFLGAGVTIKIKCKFK